MGRTGPPPSLRARDLRAGAEFLATRVLVVPVVTALVVNLGGGGGRMEAAEGANEAAWRAQSSLPPHRMSLHRHLLGTCLSFIMQGRWPLGHSPCPLIEPHLGPSGPHSPSLLGIQVEYTNCIPVEAGGGGRVVLAFPKSSSLCSLWCGTYGPSPREGGNLGISWGRVKWGGQTLELGRVREGGQGLP